MRYLGSILGSSILAAVLIWAFTQRSACSLPPGACGSSGG
jgi:hypothetical protein